MNLSAAYIISQGDLLDVSFSGGPSDFSEIYYCVARQFYSLSKVEVVGAVKLTRVVKLKHRFGVWVRYADTYPFVNERKKEISPNVPPHPPILQTLRNLPGIPAECCVRFLQSMWQVGCSWRKEATGREMHQQWPMLLFRDEGSGSHKTCCHNIKKINVHINQSVLA